MRNVYLGTSEFAAVVLRRLADSEHKPSLVVTRPARPKGRGRKLQNPPVADVAAELGIDVFQPESVNEEESVERVKSADPSALVVCAFGAIVKEPLLSLWPIFNVHPSMLPRWRGAAPVERAIAAADAETGVSIMRLVEALDAGPVCAQQPVPIGDADYGQLAPQLAELGGNLLVKALSDEAAGAIEWIDQAEMGGEAAVTYAEKIERPDRILRPTEMTAKELIARIHALTPHIGALFELAGGDPLRVEAAVISDISIEPGVAAEQDGQLLVGAREGAIELQRVKPAGGKAMDVESYLRGNPVPELA